MMETREVAMLTRDDGEVIELAGAADLADGRNPPALYASRRAPHEGHHARDLHENAMSTEEMAVGGTNRHYRWARGCGQRSAVVRDVRDPLTTSY